LLNAVVKKLQKSVNICQSYRKHKSVLFFMDHSVVLKCNKNTERNSKTKKNWKCVWI